MSTDESIKTSRPKSVSDFWIPAGLLRNVLFVCPFSCQPISFELSAFLIGIIQASCLRSHLSSWLETALRVSCRACNAQSGTSSNTARRASLISIGRGAGPT